jgi:hypothetical protein
MSQALNVVKAAVSATKSEDSALAKVVQALAATRYTSKPTVGTAKHDGVNLRVYHWSNTPLGDLLLFTGSGLEQSVLVAASELDHSPRNGMIYVPVSLSDPGAKAGQKKLESILSGKRVAQISKKAAAEGVPKAPKPAAQRVARPAAPAAKKAEKVPVVDESAIRLAALGSDRLRAARQVGRDRSSLARQLDRLGSDELRGARERGRERSRSEREEASRKSSASSEKQELVSGLQDLLNMLG